MIAFDKFAKGFVIISIVILGLIAGFNYWIDPAGIFNNRKVDLAVSYLVEGKAVTGLTNFDERIFKKELILQTKEKPKTIVLGSSRAMGIKAEFDKDNNSFANYSVSGANFNDDIALFAVYYNKYQDVPEKVILAVEPWDLNKNRGDTRWKSLEREYYTGLELINFKGEKIKEYNNISYILEKVKTLFSISYLRNSIKDFRKKETMPMKVSKDYTKTSTVLPNGSVQYGDNVNKLNSEKVYKTAQSYINNGRIYQLDNFTELDKNDIDKFYSFIKFLKSKNVEVSFWFPPYHPYVYQYIENNKKFKNVLKAEELFREIARKENLKTFGSYNPVLCGVGETDFSDGMHLRTSGYDKVFNINK